jgi:hypothetical protein
MLDELRRFVHLERAPQHDQAGGEPGQGVGVAAQRAALLVDRLDLVGHRTQASPDLLGRQPQGRLHVVGGDQGVHLFVT